MAEKKLFWRGVQAASPLFPGVLPFAMIVGVSATEMGLPASVPLGLSVVVFAGASQLTVLALFEHGAPAVVMILTALAINLRFMMYSASIAPQFQGMSTRGKSALAYLLTDQAFLLSSRQYEETTDKAGSYKYYLGVAVSLWVVWQSGTMLGVVMGKGIPESWGLDFAVPLSFLALLVPSIRNKPSLIAALVAGIALLWTRHLPLHLGLIAATLLGIIAGVIAERRL